MKMTLLGLGLMLAGLVACSTEVTSGNEVGSGSGALGEAPKSDGTCDERLASCDGVCVDLSWDNRNCGACGATCDDGLVCTLGVCSVPMDGGAAPSFTDQNEGSDDCGSDKPLLCGDTCVDPSSDDANCGACGNVCTSGARCVNGSCQ